ncbi:MAG TPA: porin, partial [Nitrospiria bacterium]
ELREYQYPVRKMSSRPMMARNLLFNEWTETGVNLYGRIGTPVASIDYDVAVVNGPNGDDGGDTDSIPEILEVGTGSNPNVGGTGDAKQNRDNNSDRTLIGRVSANFPMTVVGVSYSKGRYADTGVVADDLNFSLMGLDANFRMKGLDIRGEWAARTADVDLAVVTAPDDEMKSSSYYLQASYKVGFNRKGVSSYIEPVVRYDYLEPDDDVSDDERTRTTIGVNYSPYPHFKFMAEWQMNEGPDGAATEPKDDGFMVSATVDF